eukprot:GSChrysophyteH1.ASY1.ANO1.2665.1 assembled CDS
MAATEENRQGTEEPEEVPPSEDAIECFLTLPDGVEITLPGGVLATDTPDYIRNALQEVKEACYLTCYHFVSVNDQGEDGEVLNDYMELGQYLLDPAQTALKLRVVADKYSIAKVRNHVSRCRDLLKYPNYMASGVNSNQEDELEDSTVAASGDVLAEVAAINVDDFLAAKSESLDDFYDELLARTGVPDPVCVSGTEREAPLPSELVRSICESGWNPVSAQRQIQGDLLYLEVVTTNEGVMQVTCTADGFFINRSSRSSFDSRPASTNPSFHHELLFCLLGASPSLSHAWNALEERIKEATQATQWNSPTPTICNGVPVKPKSYDVAHAVEAATNRFGADLPGPPRDWNEDMQTARAVPGKDSNQSILRSKIIYKTSVEFQAACEKGMEAVVNGHIAPYNPMDPEENQVYLYNGIFFSGAVDLQDTFRLASGDESCRKYASHDLRNQQWVESLGVSGLHTVMQMVLDYKGTRMVAQTVIPGILAPRGNASRLLAGAVEPGKRLCMKNAAWNILEDLGKKAMLAERSVPAQPVFLPHVGPIEAKLIQGSDGRTYVLELARVTPRDANFVPKSAGGTGKIADETLDKVGEQVCTAYLLRRELIQRYLKYQADQEGKEIQERFMKEEESRRKTLEAALAAKKEEAGNNESEKDQKKDPLVEAFDAEQAVAMTMNTNVFFPGITSDANAETVAKDEQLVRDLSCFLYDQVMPAVTRGIRQQELMPLDCAAAAKILHDHGINMRYLGHMARLACKEEAEDIRLSTFDDKMMVMRMPAYWRDLLEVEMLARAVKIYLDRLLSDPSITHCAAPTIAGVISALLNTSEQANGSVPEAVNLASNANQVLSDLDEILQTRFGYSFREVRLEMIYEVITKEKAGKDLKMDFDRYAKLLSGAFGAVGNRHSHTMILRRICQQAGIRVASRKYTWQGDNCGVQSRDIHELLVRSKSCIPENISPEVEELLRSCERQIREGNPREAYRSVSECSQVLAQVVGQVHKQVALANESMANVLNIGGDKAMSLVVLQKNLLHWVQLHGLDSAEATVGHLRIADLHMELGSLSSALPHLLSARFAVELLGGINHPLMLEVAQKLATLLSKFPEKDNDSIYRLLCYARDNSLSLIHQSYVRVMVAEILKAHNNYDRAIAEMKVAHLHLQGVFGDEDPRVKEVKQKHLEYVRELTTLKVAMAKNNQKMQEEQLEKLRKMELERLEKESQKKQSDARKQYQKMQRDKRRR